MELLNVGWRKVWLDPTRIKDIAQARSSMSPSLASWPSLTFDATAGAKVRELIATDVIKVIPTHRGVINKLTRAYQLRHPGVLRFKKAYQLKQQNTSNSPSAAASIAGDVPSATSGSTTL